jgi:hypothetical protein
MALRRNARLALLRALVADRLASWCIVVILVALSGALDGAGRLDAQSAAPRAEGVAAPAETVQALQSALRAAVRRFEARDVAGVLGYVSDQYRTGPFTKAVVREQLMAMYSLYDNLTARVAIDDVRMVDGHAWVYSTGEISGQLRLIGGRAVILSWRRELEVARREGGEWRLFGYQQ